MTHDYEVARKVWEAHVPLEISLHGASSELRPFYMMIPRCSYIGLHFQKVMQYFSNYEECESLDGKTLWLECMGQPLKTYYPTGVLYDMMKPVGVDIFTLVLRGEGALDGVGIVQRDTLESMFMQSAKEADYLKRKGEIVTSMKPEEHHQLWSGVAHYRFDEFWTVNKRLMETTEGKPFLHVPIRFYETGKPFRQLTAYQCGHWVCIGCLDKVINDYRLCTNCKIPIEENTVIRQRDGLCPIDGCEYQEADTPVVVSRVIIVSKHIFYHSESLAN